jgi:hypothetical protein
MQQKTYSGGSGWMNLLRIDATGSGPTIFLGGDISSTAELGDVALTLRSTIDWFSPTAEYGYCTTASSDSPSYTARCFDIEPTVTDQAADIRLWVLNDELEDIAVEDLILYRFAGGNWQQLPSTVDMVDFTSIGYHNVTASTPGFSDFLVGSIDFIPTAVSLVDFAAKDGVGNSSLAAALLVLAVSGVLTMALLLRRRRPDQTRQ